MSAPAALIGQRLRRARTRAFLSLRELAEKSGVSFTGIQHIEQGADGRLSTVAAIAEALGLSMDRLTAPMACTTCDGNPPAGFTCQECGLAGKEATS